MGVSTGVDELCSDSHSVAGARDRAFHDSINTEFARDPGQGLLCSFVPLNRCMGDDSESAKLREVGD